MGEGVSFLLGEGIHRLDRSQLGSRELGEACLRLEGLLVGDLGVLGPWLAAEGLVGASFRFGRAFHLKCYRAITSSTEHSPVDLP